MSTGALPAVGGTRWEARVALAADLLIAVVFGGENLERGLNDTTTETSSNTSRPREYLGKEGHAPEDQMKSGLLLDVVVAESATVFELLSSED